ncbi:MAG TPA: PilN domain-containing protein [Thermoanaerobaculia bacterium]|nr:PilN domain-containing protein [Thermoanaerobaculia bacterium]
MSTLDAQPAVSAETAPQRLPRVPNGAGEEVDLDFLNLSRRPFLNSRPVVRATLLLWLLGFLLLLGNVTLFWRYRSDSETRRAELGRLEEQIETERGRVTRLKDRVASFNLQEHNEKILYLNRKIAERTFSWSLLFDQLARVMPKDVRLSRLSPAGMVQKDSERRRTGLQIQSDGRVTLTILGEAKSDEAFMQFVDNLFSVPFERPNFSRESLNTDDGGQRLLKFDMTVDYLPVAATAQEGAPAETPAVRIEEVPPAAPVTPGAVPPAATPPGAGGQP